MNTIQSVLITLLVIGYMVYRLCVPQPVTSRNLFLPLAGAAYLTLLYVSRATTTTEIAIGIGATLAGVTTGIAGASVVRLWRDEVTGMVMQRGGWKYLLVLLGLIVVRILLRVAAHALKLNVSETGLNDAFIGMAVGNYAGRAVLVGLRALALRGVDGKALPIMRD